MKKARRSLAFTLLTIVLIVSGLIMTFYSFCGVIDFELTQRLTAEIPFFSHLFPYDRFSPTVLPWILGVRMAIGLLQIITGIFLFGAHPGFLPIARLLLLLGVTSTFLNTFYSEPLVFFFGFAYAVALFTFYHEATENHFWKEIPEKSRSVLLIACLETIVSLAFLRIALWAIPPEGLTLQFTTRFGLSTIITMPQTILVLLAILLFTAGVLSLSFHPLGRIVNAILMLSIFIVNCGIALLIAPPEESALKRTYLLLIIAPMIVSSLLFFLMTHPEIKKQFLGHADTKLLGRLLQASGLVALWVIVLVSLQWSLEAFPGVYSIKENISQPLFDPSAFQTLKR